MVLGALGVTLEFEETLDPVISKVTSSCEKYMIQNQGSLGSHNGLVPTAGLFRVGCSPPFESSLSEGSRVRLGQRAFLQGLLNGVGEMEGYRTTPHPGEAEETDLSDSRP